MIRRTLALTALLIAPLSQAGVINTTGSVSLIAAPTDAKKDSAELSIAAGAPAESFLWAESQGALTAQQTVDFTASGSYTSDPGAATIAAGTFVESYMLYFDVVGGASGTGSGSITFDTDVLGVIATATGLQQSHATFGNAGTSYLTGSSALQGIWDSSGDAVALSADLRTIDFNFTVIGFIDTIRILTAASPAPVPTPAPLALFAVTALALLRRR